MKFVDISLFIRPNVRSFAHKARCHTHTDLPHTQPSVAHTQPLSHTQFREIAKSNNFMFRRPLRARIFDSQAVFVALTRNLLIWLVETVNFRYSRSNIVFQPAVGLHRFLILSSGLWVAGIIIPIIPIAPTSVRSPTGCVVTQASVSPTTPAVHNFAKSQNARISRPDDVSEREISFLKPFSLR